MQELISLFQTSPTLFILFVGLISLIIGSFLNVVIVRMPEILERDWRMQCHDLLGTKATTAEQEDIKQNHKTLIGLVVPRSHCPRCHALVHAYDNIPIISYILLRGKCRNCKKHISIQYPLIEGITAILAMAVAWRFGPTWQTVAGCLLTYTLITQSIIDLKHTIIPDEITIPILWVGILINYNNIFVDLNTSVLGAVFGYLSLWIIYWIFYLITKKEGMGYGDFKLLAMLGAWLGWQMLPFIILFSSLVGSLAGISLILSQKIKMRNKRIPFGPFLAIAGWIALIMGSKINAWYASYAGIL